MHRQYRVLLCAFLLVPFAATAAAPQPSGSVGGYLTRTDVDAGGVSDDGIGPGLRAWASFGVPFAHFEYQTVSIDTPVGEIDVESLRLGGGAGFQVSDPLTVLGKAEYIDLGSDVDEDGFGLHGGAVYALGPKLHVFGTLGYLMLNDTDGLELNAGAALHFTPQFGVFSDVRRYMGDIDNAPPGADDFEVTEVHAGAMFSWGM